nr:MAG TPA: hypothetical protein [Caudoviricetes sp.]
MLTNSCFLTPIFVKVILSLRHIIISSRITLDPLRLTLCVIHDIYPQ